MLCIRISLSWPSVLPRSSTFFLPSEDSSGRVQVLVLSDSASIGGIIFDLLQDAVAAHQRAAKAEQDAQENNERSQYELKNQIQDLERQLRDREASHQGLQEEQATLHQQIQSAKVRHRKPML